MRRLRTFVVVFALLAFVIDFATPTTPTPVAVNSGKIVAQPLLAVIAAVVVTHHFVPLVHSFLAHEGVFACRSALLDLTCIRRC